MVFHGVPLHLEQMLCQTSKLGSIGSTWKLQARWCWTMMRAGLQRSLARPLFLASRASEVCEVCCTMEKTICFGRSMLFLVEILGTDHRTSILPKLTLFAGEKLKVTTGDRLVPATVDVRLDVSLAAKSQGCACGRLGFTSEISWRKMCHGHLGMGQYL